VKSPKSRHISVSMKVIFSCGTHCTELHVCDSNFCLSEYVNMLLIHARPSVFVYLPSSLYMQYVPIGHRMIKPVDDFRMKLACVEVFHYHFCRRLILATWESDNTKSGADDCTRTIGSI
jgi:hypothetical protein